MNGQYGELLIQKLLKQRGFLVTDVSKNPQYWEKDIDLIATNPKTGAAAAIEVKTDSVISRTGNFFIEIENPRSKGRKGWYYFCQADLIYYLDQINSILYIFKFSDLKQYIQQNHLRIRETSDGAKGYIISIDAAPIYNTIDLEDL